MTGFANLGATQAYDVASNSAAHITPSLFRTAQPISSLLFISSDGLCRRLCSSAACSLDRKWLDACSEEELIGDDDYKVNEVCSSAPNWIQIWCIVEFRGLQARIVTVVNMGFWFSFIGILWLKICVVHNDLDEFCAFPCELHPYYCVIFLVDRGNGSARHSSG